jgi:DNA repair protein RecN (Recombination protein N)
MLAELEIENIALIDRLNIQLGEGLNVLSGETGAGKSIIIDSLNFVLGERADKSLIRYGTDFSVVQAVFSDYSTQAVNAYLSDMGIDIEDVLILRRKMSADGKNECRINGRLTNLSVLKGLTELLVDIHGQHEHQSLLKSSNHMMLLDSIGEAEIAKAKADVKALHSEYSQLKKEKSSLGNSEERARKLDILSYQIEEIEKAAVEKGEEDVLLEKRKRIRNMEKILSALESARNTLDGYDGASVTANVKNATAFLSSIASFDERISALTDRLEAAKAEIADIAQTTGDLLEQLDFDSRTADDIEHRLETVRSIQRKYGGNYDSLQLFYKNARAELDMLSNAEERVEKIDAELRRISEKLVKAAENLTKFRNETARYFEWRVIGELGDLGMSGSIFKVEITTAADVDEISENGADSVEFLISPNVGEPLKPLAKIISGGEMSRFMLALKNIVAGIDHIGTMVFDEIDTGISGNISVVVAEKMCNISRNRQVIAVTHMPSLAAMADRHYLIQKSAENGKTLTRVTPLEDDTAEVARLIGGSDYSLHAQPHAKEMKAWAERYKQSLKA